MERESDQYKFRNELLKQYVYLAFATSLLVAPLEYHGGMAVLGLVLNAFSVVMFLLIFSIRNSAMYLMNSRLFMVAISGLFLAGFIYSSPYVDNRYFLLLYPIAAFSIRGTKEGIVWAGSLLFCFIPTFLLLHHGESGISFILFAIAFFMVSYVVYYYRFYEIRNFQHIGQIQAEKDRLLNMKEAEARQLQTLSHTDFLTGLYNRHKLDAVLANAIVESRERERPFGIILLDVDHFKQVNDKYGHQAGDALLKEMATLLKGNIRDADVVGRWGGEEFLVISPDNHEQGTLSLAEKLRSVVASHAFPVVNAKTISLGASNFRDGDTTESLIERCDEALYRAKHHGRNRVEAG